MARIIFLTIFIFTCSVEVFADNGFRLSSKDLIAYAKQLDGENVIFTGEVIGDIMHRNEHAWVNILDEFGSMSIWISAEQAAEISFKGDYRHRGDIVEVEGQFSRADPTLGGELCIRARNLKVVSPGNVIIYSLNEFKEKLSLILLAISVVVLALRLMIKHKRQ